MTEGDACQEFRFQKIDENKKFFLEEIKQNNLMTKKDK